MEGTLLYSARDGTCSLVYAGQILSASEPPLKSLARFLSSRECFLVTAGTLSQGKLV